MDPFISWLVSVSNGDVLSIAQLLVLYYLYKNVHRIETVLMNRVAGSQKKSDPDL